MGFEAGGRGGVTAVAAGQGGMTVVAGGQGGVAAVIAVVVGWGSWWCFLMGLCLMLQS